MDRIINILLAEDDRLDVIDLRRAFDKMNFTYHLYEAKNGEDAIELLKEMGSKGQEGLPDFVLIDINMPRMNGLELLQNIRENEAWKHLKCFIITTSVEKVDKDRAAALGISGYIVKPLKLTNPATMDTFNLVIDLLNE